LQQFKAKRKTTFRIPLKFHFLFWGSYFTLNFIRWGSYFNDYWYSLKSNLVEFPLHIVLVYFTIYFLVPKFILIKRYAFFFILFTCALSFHYILRTGFNYLLVSKNIWPEAEGVHNAYQFNHILEVTLGEVYVVAFVATIKLTVEWIYQNQKIENLKKLQLKTELDFLKSQIQPHFFFNTLNNLYALTLEKSDIAPSVVLKLSDIMQYVLYEVKEPLIQLSTEIKYIQNYLDVEEMRHGTNVKMKLSIKGDITGILLPPLLFLPFIENCFKHGIKSNDHLKVKIGFKIVENKRLIFTTENNFVDTSSETKQGIGNINVERRLELLYKKSFDLTSKVSEDNYKVKMSLPINKDL
tara:strand:+ start:50760 stop:51818 length:1059 start_codon:yes stop_codon:yes gene_type:complete